MRRSFLMTAAVVLLTAMLLFNACHYKDLCYDHHHDVDYNMYLKLELNLDIDIDIEGADESHAQIKIPTYMVVCFYDTLSGALKEMEYVGTYGGPLHVNPGTYDMVVYSFDTEWTQVRGDQKRDSLEAYTSDITATKSPIFSLFAQKDSMTAPGPIIYTPDHLLVTRKRVEIPPYSLEEKVITIEATASTIVETYSFEVINVTGVEYVASVEAFITNQARASYFGRGEVSQEPATIYFPMDADKQLKTLKSYFTTFGKLPGESKSFLNIVLTDTEGKPYTFVTDITEQFENDNHSIVVEDSVVIPEPATSGTGISPTVEDWEEENHDIGIG